MGMCLKLPTWKIQTKAFVIVKEMNVVKEDPLRTRRKAWGGGAMPPIKDTACKNVNSFTALSKESN